MDRIAGSNGCAAAGDTLAAAVEQPKYGAIVTRCRYRPYYADSASVIYDALSAAKGNSRCPDSRYSRAVTEQKNLMDELSKINRVLRS